MQSCARHGKAADHDLHAITHRIVGKQDVRINLIQTDYESENADQRIVDVADATCYTIAAVTFFVMEDAVRRGGGIGDLCDPETFPAGGVQAVDLLSRFQFCFEQSEERAMKIMFPVGHQKLRRVERGGFGFSHDLFEIHSTLSVASAVESRGHYA